MLDMCLIGALGFLVFFGLVLTTVPFFYVRILNGL